MRARKSVIYLRLGYIILCLYTYILYILIIEILFADSKSQHESVTRCLDNAKHKRNPDNTYLTALLVLAKTRAKKCAM